MCEVYNNYVIMYIEVEIYIFLLMCLDVIRSIYDIGNFFGYEYQYC